MKIKKLMWGITILSIYGVILNIEKNSDCFRIWIVTNFLWLARNYYIKEWAQVGLFSIYLILAVIGLIYWR